MKESRPYFTPRCLAIAALVMLALPLASCNKGPGKYEISGTVTYGDQPIRTGSIMFEPMEGKATRETIAMAQIENGRYAAAVVGGPHLVSIRDLGGEASGAEGTRPSFTMEYTTKAELPKQPTSDLNFQVPVTHK